MIIEARSFPEGKVVEHDVAIIGGGPAGISIAREIASSSPMLSVGIFEGGGTSYEEEGHQLYHGLNTGSVLETDDSYIHSTRLRYLGGTSNHWHGWCLPLEELDFKKRSWVNHSGWPVTGADLAPYYERALPLIQIHSWNYPLRTVAKGNRPTLLKESSSFKTAIFHRSPPVRFGSEYRDALKQSKNISVYLHANAVNISSHSDGRNITQIDLRSPEGAGWSAKARLYILAAGGLENPRLLLLSRNKHAKGIGNHNDLVGRFFMEHIQLVHTGDFFLSGSKLNYKLYERFFEHHFKHVVLGILCPTAQLQEDHQLLNCSIFFLNPYQRHAAFREQLTRALPAFDHPEEFKKESKSIFRAGSLESRSEQSPNPDSRVTLLPEKDALGMQRLHLDWRLQQTDRDSVKKTFDILAREFGKHADGRVRVLLNENSSWERSKTLGGAHHMGTTRMHSSDKYGVVNSDCRVHGVDNLYIAGSSVFPTVGFANPTLTILALALRLADHLKERLL